MSDSRYRDRARALVPHRSSHATLLETVSVLERFAGRQRSNADAFEFQRGAMSPRRCAHKIQNAPHEVGAFLLADGMPRTFAFGFFLRLSAIPALWNPASSRCFKIEPVSPSGASREIATGTIDRRSQSRAHN